jgi:hypothetical protein
MISSFRAGVLSAYLAFKSGRKFCNTSDLDIASAVNKPHFEAQNTVTMYLILVSPVSWFTRGPNDHISRTSTITSSPPHTVKIQPAAL